MRNQEYKEHLVNATGDINKIGNCEKYVLTLDSSPFTKRVDACIAKCPPPCSEIKYGVSVAYEEGKKDLSGNPYSRVTLRLKFTDFIVTEIGEQPAYDVTALISNFGGTLGLMCGMSAVSILELLIWLFLSVAIALFRLHKKFI